MTRSPDPVEDDRPLPAGQLYLAVALSALVVYLGALWNRFAFDDLFIVAHNPLVRSLSGVWRAFGASYWPADVNTSLYRPLTVATYALDWVVGSAAWFHAVNVLWHVAATVLVTALTLRWAGQAAALGAGVLFAVHPVHVEAVANVVGRNELMAATFALLALYAALERESVLWSAAAIAGALLSKENGAATPGLIAWAWLVQLRPPPDRRKLARYVASWGLLGAGYIALRGIVFRPYGERVADVAPVFIGQSPLSVRLTALSGLTDLGRLLVFPFHLQADYSPLERTAVTSLWDGRLAMGLLILACWVWLITLAIRHGRRIEAAALGWIGIAYSPVANLLFPIGVFIAERTLYLPSVGLAMALGATLRNLPRRRLGIVLALLFVAGAARTVVRVPVWRDDVSATASLVQDAPMSYTAYYYAGWRFLGARRAEKALPAFLHASELYDRDHRVYLAAADAAFTLGRAALGDSLLGNADKVCLHQRLCLLSYRNQAGAARLRGDSAAADELTAHARRLAAP